MRGIALLEVLLHEFAHIEESPDELDHGNEFYQRLAELTMIAESNKTEFEGLFGTSLDFSEVYEYVVDSVNEYTVESEIDSVEERQSALRKKLSNANQN